MDTETVNRVITEITNRLGVGYSVFSDAVSQYAQARATEGLIYSVAIFSVIILAVAIFFLCGGAKQFHRFRRQSCYWFFCRSYSGFHYFLWHL